MSLHPIKCLLVVGSMLLFSIGPARAQTPSPEAMSVARSLVAALKHQAHADAGQAGD